MLNKDQIKFLKALAHHLNPVILIGANGITENVDKEINQALNSHELIKIKLGNLEDATQEEMIQHIITSHNAEYVQKIGHQAIFFRRNPKNPKIELPKPVKKGSSDKKPSANKK